jgi:hypothetical protein
VSDVQEVSTIVALARKTAWRHTRRTHDWSWQTARVGWACFVCGLLHRELPVRYLGGPLADGDDYRHHWLTHMGLCQSLGV